MKILARLLRRIYTLLVWLYKKLERLLRFANLAYLYSLKLLYESFICFWNMDFFYGMRLAFFSWLVYAISHIVRKIDRLLDK